MVISSSPARSNDQSWVAATRSTSSSGFARILSLVSIRDIPVSALPLFICDARDPTRTTLALDAVPGGAVEPLRGESLGNLNINPLIPGDKVPPSRMGSKDSWISAAIHSFRRRARETDDGVMTIRPPAVGCPPSPLIEQARHRFLGRGPSNRLANQ